MSVDMYVRRVQPVLSAIDICVNITANSDNEQQQEGLAE